jgi:hypothetical protein
VIECFVIHKNSACFVYNSQQKNLKAEMLGLRNQVVQQRSQLEVRGEEDELGREIARKRDVLAIRNEFTLLLRARCQTENNFRLLVHKQNFVEKQRANMKVKQQRLHIRNELCNTTRTNHGLQFRTTDMTTYIGNLWSRWMFGLVTVGLETEDFAS